MSKLVTLNRLTFPEPIKRADDSLQIKLFAVIFLLRERDSTDKSLREEHLPILVVLP